MHECEDGFHYCLRQARQSGKVEYARAAHLCIDCAEVCGTAAKLVASGSHLLVHICAAFAGPATTASPRASRSTIPR